jgi:hypothetical protein
MGMQDILFGYIAEAAPWRSTGDEKESKLRFGLTMEIRKHNRNVLNILPSNDEWPPLSQKMFHSVSHEHLLAYRNPIIVFGGDFKSICYDWTEWLRKFEILLQQLYWENAVVNLHSELVGEHQLIWRVKNEWLEKVYNRQLEKITEWEFNGIRNFHINC